MGFKTITKLKLETGATLKLATVRDSFWTLQSDVPFLVKAERYITKKGDNLRYGTAQGATRSWTLDNDNVTPSTLSFTNGTVHEYRYVITPPPDLTYIDYEALDSFSYSMFGSPTSGIGNFWFANQGACPPDGEVMMAAAIDEETGNGFCALIWTNPSPFVSELGTYSVYRNQAVIIGTAEEWLNGAYSDSTDPYEDEGGDNDGGEGEDTNDSDPIEIPELPTIGAIDSGLINLYSPSVSDLRNLAGFLWSDLFSIDTFKKIFSNPMEAILGLSIVPVNIPSVASAVVPVGNISTGVSMPVVSAQYVKVNCGSIAVKELWGSYLDYDPITKVEIYLPYVGVRPLKTDDVMKKSIHVEYNVDILSGSCVAFVKCGGSVLYEYAGQCSTIVPINGQNWNSAISSAISMVASLGLAAATGGGSAPLTATQMAGKTAMAGASIAGNVMNAKPSIERSGGIGSSAGIMGNQTPFLIITRPKACVPSNQNKFEGYPSYKTKKLSSCSGYTEVESIHLENISATDAEKNEIERLLMQGVII